MTHAYHVHTCVFIVSLFHTITWYIKGIYEKKILCFFSTLDMNAYLLFTGLEVVSFKTSGDFVCTSLTSINFDTDEGEEKQKK